MVGDDRLSTAVVRAVAAREGIDSENLVPRLGERIDPDALDRLFAPTPDGTPRADGTVIFDYYGYTVTVGADGDVDLQG